jgi:hypothetical protein
MRFPAPLLTLAVVLVACSEAVTAPTQVSPTASFGGLPTGTEFVVLSAGGRVPPPPLDTNYVAFNDGGGSSVGTSTFFVNKTGNNAWITFNDGTGNGAAPTGSIHFKNNGTIDARGTLTFIGANGQPSALDLSTADFTGTVINGSCAQPAQDPQFPPGPCASIPFTGLTTGGTPITGGISVGTPQRIIGDGQIG